MGPTDPQPTDAPGRSLGALAMVGVAVVLAAALLCAGPLLRSQLIEYELQVDAAWKDVEVQLQRQHELLPKLVQVVKSHQAYEAGVIDKVLAADTRMAQAGRGERPGAARDMETALLGVMRAAQRFPELVASSQFRDLSYEIAGTKNRIAIARTRYNDAVAVLNARRRQFPWSLVGDAVAERPFYDPPAQTQVDPQLDL